MHGMTNLVIQVLANCYYLKLQERQLLKQLLNLIPGRNFFESKLQISMEDLHGVIPILRIPDKFTGSRKQLTRPVFISVILYKYLKKTEIELDGLNIISITAMIRHYHCKIQMVVFYRYLLGLKLIQANFCCLRYLKQSFCIY